MSPETLMVSTPGLDEAGFVFAPRTGESFLVNETGQAIFRVLLSSGDEDAAVLERLLAKRFGLLDEESRNRLGQATLEQLDLWTDRILDAATVSAVSVNCRGGIA